MGPTTTIAVIIWSIAAPTAIVDQPNDHDLQRQFADTVRPFLQTYCFGCHGPKKAEAQLDLSTYQTAADVAKGYRRWNKVMDRLEAEEMPPEEAKRHPTPDQRAAIINWIRSLRQWASQQAGDPGQVLPRRLSNAEYDYTIRDLAGVDIRPAREFPVDPANEAGFDNSGESLAMSPALMKKYLEAARLVADHIVLKPQGFVFAPHPAVTETDRDKYCVQRIVDFYARQPTTLEDYFFAAWQFQHRDAIGKPDASLREFAVEAGLSVKYLAIIWSALTDPQTAGPLMQVQSEWLKLSRDVNQEQEVRNRCEQIRELVVKLRKQFEPKVEKLHLKGVSDGSQPLVLRWNRQIAAQRLRYSGDEGGNGAGAAAAFCRVFPDAFYVSARGAYFDPKLGAESRLLTAGFHLMHGYFRDDAPLYELILDQQAQKELDTLWQELEFITLAPIRQYKDFIFFERAEPPRFMEEAKFDFARSEDKDATSQAKIERLSELYLAKAREKGASSDVIEAIEYYFRDISAQIRWVEQTRLAAEPSHIESLLAFAQRSYRRPLSQAERDDLIAFYRALRERDGLSHEDSIRDTVVSVLMSPHFCYRIDVPRAADAAQQPLTEYALASRLSYFLWSTMPDDQLLAHADAGNLHDPDVLLAQVKRMLKDSRVRGLASEFGGNWLDFRRFEEHNGVDRSRFQEFDDELRAAMYEEPVRFFMEVVQENRSVLDFLYGKHTLVNRALAKHYRIPLSNEGSDGWVRVDDADQYGRGGLMPMAVFLTKNAPGLRTSPVKRGYWVVRRLLGETIPPPPPQVPELPKDEATTGELTMRQLLATHRANKSCAACHERFDSIGLAFEGYGPIGERRDQDLAGRPVDTTAVFPGGVEGNGLDGLRDYLAKYREAEFLDNLCRKLLAYALGRNLIISDEALIEEMRINLSRDGYRFAGLVQSIVASPQFRTQRSHFDFSENERQ
jgi:hypothetical protein